MELRKVFAVGDSYISIKKWFLENRSVHFYEDSTDSIFLTWN